VKRREFITLLGGAAAAWPFDARTQQSDRVRRIGVLINTVDNDPDAIARLSALQKALRELGWDEGRNLQIDTRWGVDDDRIRRNAAELIALAPDVILANGPPPAMALQQATRSVPIVFVGVTDPVGMGIVQSLARPGGNATGFISAEFGLSVKWLEMLKEMAPGVRRVAVLRESSNPSGLAQFAAIQGVAPSFRRGTEPTRRARRRRDRARRRSLCAPGQRRHDRDPNCGDDCPPRRDHQGGITKSVASRLSAAGLRHRGRPDILRP
jgi:putative tryptophan/tyrosine transport system substrate-binding protein